MTRLIISLVAALACFGTAPAANDTTAPIRYRHGGTTVIMHNSTTAVSIAAGDTALDKARTFTCVSAAGCVIMMNANAHLQNDSIQMAICPMVDGVQGVPASVQSGDLINPLTAHQMLTVGQGPHTVQTFVKSEFGGPTVDQWETDYTIYERRVKGAD